MGLRITTWNVNGIRNPFGYQPWRDKRSFAAMFDILEADIIVFQETKIQRKDLSDDMILVPGWDCYFSLPKHKKGYSGVVIYTRQSVCAPIRAEEGITGILCPPNSSVPFSELPTDQQIGGYPNSAQLSASAVDAATLDSEGRAVILEFPAFVLIGVYSPANRDETRDDYRIGFLDVLDSRIRNLDAIGKRVILTGDLNISREERDTANAESSMRKQGLTSLEYISTPARRLFNQLLEGGKVVGPSDEGRERPILQDICRRFHPDRKGMFTCWEQKTNARPANCGARIDYVLCSLNMQAWFCDSNIQEGLMGSDHCPVYAVMKDRIEVDGREIDVCDLMNPPGMFNKGKRQREYLMTVDPLPMSGKLIPEFAGRRNIRDMFSRTPSLLHTKSSAALEEPPATIVFPDTGATADQLPCTNRPRGGSEILKSPALPSKKRTSYDASLNSNAKRLKSSSSTPVASQTGKGQQTLKGFLMPKPNGASDSGDPQDTEAVAAIVNSRTKLSTQRVPDIVKNRRPQDIGSQRDIPVSDSDNKCESYDGPATAAKPRSNASLATNSIFVPRHSDVVHDPVESKESWSKLFTRPIAPRCEGHEEPCISLLTKKPGMNLGRSFWMCPRPLGPSGAKEKNTQWRCQTFIWCSDWNPHVGIGA